MITVREFKDLCTEIVPVIEIEGYVLASTYEQGSNKLKDKSGLRLVGVYPAYNFGGEPDSILDKNEMLLYIVVRQKEGGTDEQEIDQYSATLDAMLRLKNYLTSNRPDTYCMIFPNIDVSSIQIDPEYNIFGGYLGYSIKFIC
jgi:hypothetical protein